MTVQINCLKTGTRICRIRNNSATHCAVAVAVAVVVVVVHVVVVVVAFDDVISVSLALVRYGTCDSSWERLAGMAASSGNAATIIAIFSSSYFKRSGWLRITVRTTVTFVSAITAVIMTITDDIRWQTVAFHWTAKVVVQTVCIHRTRTLTCRQIPQDKSKDK